MDVLQRPGGADESDHTALIVRADGNVHEVAADGRAVPAAHYADPVAAGLNDLRAITVVLDGILLRIALRLDQHSAVGFQQRNPQRLSLTQRLKVALQIRHVLRRPTAHHLDAQGRLRP